MRFLGRSGGGGIRTLAGRNRPERFSRLPLHGSTMRAQARCATRRATVRIQRALICLDLGKRDWRVSDHRGECFRVAQLVDELRDPGVRVDAVAVSLIPYAVVSVRLGGISRAGQVADLEVLPRSRVVGVRVEPHAGSAAVRAVQRRGLAEPVDAPGCLLARGPRRQPRRRPLAEVSGRGAPAAASAYPARSLASAREAARFALDGESSDLMAGSVSAAPSRSASPAAWIARPACKPNVAKTAPATTNASASVSSGIAVAVAKARARSSCGVRSCQTVCSRGLIAPAAIPRTSSVASARASSGSKSKTTDAARAVAQVDT
jgi:hypothetical protein